MKFILSILLLISGLLTYSYYTYGNGSKTPEQIAADNEERQRIGKICDAQRQIATLINDKQWSYYACLKNRGGNQ